MIAPILIREGATSYIQSDLINRKGYHGSVFYQHYMRPYHIEDSVSSVALNADGLAVGVTVCRCKGDPPFSDQDRATVELFNKLLTTKIGKPLATSYHISAGTLSPRLRDTLVALIEGDSEKLLARRLKISPSTAHEYAAAIYKHFRVRGRTDLMAYLLKREPKLLLGSVSR
jgi:DNA-binding CsgD family transcriptional regulator